MRNMRNILRHLLILAVLPLAGCDLDNTIPKDELIPRKDFVLTRSELDFINENNGFALDLFKRVAQNEGGKSIVISPLSVTLDFGMVNNGAAGDTRSEINSVIGFKDGTVEDFNRFCQSMLTQSCQVDPTTTLEFANAAVINSFYIPLKKDFTSRVKDSYSAEVIYKDFHTEDIKGLVNKWCGQKTRGMIKELVKEPVSPENYAQFLTATYFKGIWSNQFKKGDTKKETFFCEDGNEAEVKMMHQKSGFRMASILDGDGAAIVLPYGNEAYRMNILLPRNGKTIKDITDNLDSESWTELLDYLGKHLGVSNEIDVKIPVFETEYECSLNGILQDMGISKAFTDEADFSGMTDEDIFINDLRQKTRIKVDEQGSEAASVVDISLWGGASLNPVQPTVWEFHADHPFIYAITEVSSGAIFFIGQYTGR